MKHGMSYSTNSNQNHFVKVSVHSHFVVAVALELTNTNLPSLLAYTTTSEFLKSGRTTSRVLQHPGGTSSVQLGWDSPKKEDKPKEVVDSNAEASVTGAKKDVTKMDTNVKDSKSAVSSNAFATGSAQESYHCIHLLALATHMY